LIKKEISENNKDNWIKIICGSCLIQIAYDLAKKSTDNNKKQIEIIRETFKILSEISKDSFTTKLSSDIIRKVEELTGIIDPYQEEKRFSNKFLLELEPKMLELINSIKNPFDKFFKIILLTIFGNTIDFATGHYDFELSKKALEDKMSKTINLIPSIDDSTQFYDLIKFGNKQIMYLIDNSGEIVCDKLLIKNLVEHGNNVVVVVKNKPLINDALKSDAIDVNISKIKNVKIIESERFCLGFLFNNETEEFIEALSKTDIIIAKGQNHFETIIKYKEKFARKIIILILTLKCLPLAEFLGVKKGDLVIKLLDLR